MRLHNILLVLSVFALSADALAQQTVADSIVHNGLVRYFQLRLPTTANDTQNRPLVLNLHGGSGNMVSAQGFTQMNPVADANGFAIAWPQGYGVAPPGFSWADGRNTSADQAGVDDVGFLNALVDSLVEDYGFDDQRIYICGFSNGGFMVQRMACESPSKFAAMASLGCSMDVDLFAACSPDLVRPFLMMNGTSDPAMPYEGGPMENPLVTPVVPVEDAVNFWKQTLQCQTENSINLPNLSTSDNSSIERFQYTNCHCSAEMWFYRIDNGGHTWPGVYLPQLEATLGVTNLDISASSELWAFFEPFSLCNIPLSAEELIFREREVYTVYPNPVGGVLMVTGDMRDLLRVTLRSLDGKVVHDIQRPRFPLDLGSLNRGVYVVEFHTANGRISQRLLKQ